MNIETFVQQSEGKWRSMRSGHSLAFQQFEDVLSEVEIKNVDPSSSSIQELIESSNFDSKATTTCPFQMEWKAEVIGSQTIPIWRSRSQSR